LGIQSEKETVLFWTYNFKKSFNSSPRSRVSIFLGHGMHYGGVHSCLVFSAVDGKILDTWQMLLK
jgi:hypothetical protein